MIETIPNVRYSFNGKVFGMAAGKMFSLAVLVSGGDDEGQAVLRYSQFVDRCAAETSQFNQLY
ncbi:hypothetical protein [Corynebacterium rouxii]|uniref:Uncharacterized protein n=1 Tax=Corynebacterium rouxii TaxID=2719119 RepID=A0ABU3PPI0_9CORY|nr:hypothetical protein [Corynebacterium rouxii]MDT9409490.1 hypothetical protein [Corynebacterium rouxii]MDT9411723.1 hypothetical protein [Corynebacterium rouxii]